MMGRSPTEYGVWFIPTAGGYIIGNVITSRLSVRFWRRPDDFLGQRHEPRRHCSRLCSAAICLDRRPARHRLPGTLMGLANGIILPNSIAGAVSVRPQAAGTASGHDRLHADAFRRGPDSILRATSLRARPARTPALLCMLATAVCAVLGSCMSQLPAAESAVVDADREVRIERCAIAQSA